MSSRALLLAVAGWMWSIFVLGCAQVAPPAPVRSTLGPLDRPSSGGDGAGVWRVEHVAPRGDATTEASEITVIFSKPARALGGAPAPVPEIRIDPPLPGRWLWVGSRALRFVPDGGLPRTTAIHVTIAAGARSLDGDQLAQPYEWTFQTPGPSLVSHVPSANEDHVPPGEPIELSFDQEIDPHVLSNALSVTAEHVVDESGARVAPVAVPFEIEPLDFRQSRFRVQPRVKLPAGATIRVSIGPLGPGRSTTASEPESFKFTTWGPLEVVGASCTPEGLHDDGDGLVAPPGGSCSPEGIIALSLTNLVDDDLVAALLEVSPSPGEISVHSVYDEDGRVSYRVRAAFEHRTTYRVRLRRALGALALVDDQGQALAEDFVTELRFGDRAPEAELHLSGTYGPVHESLAIPVRLTNVSDAKLEAAFLTPDAVMARLAKDDAPAVAWRPAKRFADPETNVTVIERPRLEDLLGTSRLVGSVAVRLSYREKGHPDGPRRELMHEVQLSDHASFHRVAHDRVHVWVLERETGAPVPGAQITLRRTGDPEISRVATDATGRASMALPTTGEELVVFVERGAEWTYHVLERPDEPALLGTLFSDRGLYRPGEVVSLKGIVRRPTEGGLVTPTAESIEAEIVGPEGDVVTRLTLSTNRFGAFHTTFLVPPDAPLGLYGARVKNAHVWARFTVAEYHPAEFEVEALLSRTVLMRGEDLSCTASGRYLYGGAMAGAGVRVAMSRRPESFRPEGYPGYAFDGGDEWFFDDVGSEEHGELDEAGRYEITRRLNLPGMTGPESVVCHVAASDLDHRALAGGSAALVHPGEYYVGMKSPAILSPGDRFTVDVVAVTPGGLAREVDVELSLRRLTRASPGAPYDEIPLESCRVRTQDSSACSFTVPAGEYGDARGLRLRAHSTDPRGNPIYSMDDLYVRMPPAVPPPPPRRPAPAPLPSPRMLSLRGMADQYAVGDELTVDVVSPFDRPATLLASVEREGIIAEQIVPLPTGGTKVRLTVTEAMVPNAHLHLTAVLGPRSEATEGSFLVSSDGHRLEVDLRPSKAHAAPGEEIDIEVVVTDHEGRPVGDAEVTLWGADEGTLMLARYLRPDPFVRLFAERYGSLRSFDTRSHPLSIGRFHRTRPPRVRMGATSVGARNPRADFRQSVLFEPSLVTDERGRVRHRIKLPDGLTTYRFFAVAATEGDSFGSAETELRTRQQLMARPSLPAVVRVRDRFSATVVLSTHDLPATEVDVEIEATGLEVLGSPARRVRLEPDRPERIELSLDAPRAGAYRVTVRARSRSGSAEDAFTLTGEVVSPTFVETAAVYGATDRPVSELVGDLSAIRPDVGELAVAMSSSPLVGAQEGMEELLRYPYGCVEQTLSQMLPLVALRDLADHVGADLPADPAPMVDAAIGRLVSAQKKDGGFGFWSGSRHSEPWLTAYAVLVLSEAKRRGQTVPDAVMSASKRYLQAELVSILGQPDPSRSDLSVAAIAIDALAALGEPIGARARRLYVHRERLDPSARALFLHALAVGGGPKPMRAAMLDAALAAVRLNGPTARLAEARAPGGAFDSSAEPLVIDSTVQGAALTLRALIAIDPDHALAAPLARGLIADRTGGSWRSTHETAWVMVALDSYRRAHPGAQDPFDVRLFLGDALVAERELGGEVLNAKLEIPVARLRGLADRDPTADRLTFDVGEGGHVYYEARLRYARQKLPREPIEQGFAVERTSRVVAGATGLATSAAATSDVMVSAGDVIRVDVTVVGSSPHRAVAVEAPLPGGFVALAPELFDDSPEEFPSYGAGRLWDRRELRDDRVLFFVDRMPAGVATFTFYARALHPGTFVVPPTSAFEMYAPETHGSTAATRVRIASPR